MLDRYIQKFMTYLEIEKNSSRHTITNYKIDLREFNNSIKEKPLEGITHVDVRLFLARMKEKDFSKINSLINYMLKSIKCQILF
jgi:integrase/recombinase XerC